MNKECLIYFEYVFVVWKVLECNIIIIVIDEKFMVFVYYCD